MQADMKHWREIVKKHSKILLILITCVVSSIVTMTVFVGLTIWRVGGTTAFSSLIKYTEVMRIINEVYVGEGDTGKISDMAYTGMIAALEDPWSYYMSADEFAQYQQYSENMYEGIGITLQLEEENAYHKIVSVTPDTPAAQAGVLPGQYLIAINGTDLSQMPMAEIRGMIRLSHGAVLQLLLRTEDGTEITATVQSEAIYTEPVSYRMLEDDVGYIQIKNFESRCAEGFQNAMDDLMQQGAKGFLFDVRSNPGGKVTELMEILDTILPEGDLFVMRDKAGNERIHVSDADCIALPMAVLVNGDSYSAAEFFAAALSEYDWAEVVGENTTGKGRAQITIPLSDGSAVHISSSAYLTPKRVDLSQVGGITPDYVVPLSEENRALFALGALDTALDDQLNTALDIVRASR